MGINNNNSLEVVCDADLENLKKKTYQILRQNLNQKPMIVIGFDKLIHELKEEFKDRTEVIICHTSADFAGAVASC